MFSQIKSLHIYLILLVGILIFSCENDQKSDYIYLEGDLSSIGWKNKGGFETNFPESNFARWGYIKGREVAIILYDTPEAANNFGQIAGEEQTEIIEQAKTDSDSGDSGSFYGPKVEKTGCRGFSGAALFRGECPRREPLYTVFKIDGNALVMFEPLRSEDNELAAQRLQELLILLNENYKE